MKNNLLKRIFSGLATLSLLANSLIAPLSVYSQEETAATEKSLSLSTSESEVEPSPEELPSPTPTLEPEITPEATPSPTVEPRPEADQPLDETIEVVPTPTTEDNSLSLSDEPSPEPISEEIEAVQPETSETTEETLSETSETPEESESVTPVTSEEQTENQPEPTVVPVEPEEGTLSAVILKDTLATSISEFDFDYQQEGSASLVTDKPDYAPTDTVLIYGTGFTPDKEYALEITSDTGNFKFTDTVTSDESGSIFYTLQLDGTYRPLYLVEAINSDGVVVASVTFTDSRTTNSATLNGGSSVSVYPGSAITIAVTATLTSGDDWHSTGRRISSSSGIFTCVNTPDHNSNGTFTESFSVNAPANPGTYNVYLRISGSNSNCNNNTGNTITLNNAVTVLARPSWPTSWSNPNSCVADPANDENPDEIDLIGSVGTPAIGFNSDSNYYYLRERVDGDPGSGSSFHQYAWVTLFQTSTPQYQYLGSLNGKDDKVQLWQNTSPAGPIDFNPLLNDPAETLLWEGSSAIYARRVSPGGGVYYVDWAIPAPELTSRGIGTSTTRFFATSADANNFNKDHLLCYEALSDLSIVKSDNPDPVTNGDTLTYTLTISNSGPDTASGVVVSDTLPAGYAVTSVTPSQGACSDTSAPSIQCELGSLANGANATITIVGTITTDQLTVTNTASVTLDTTVSTDTNSANNSDSEDTAVTQQGTLRVIKTAVNDNGGSAEAGDFTVHVKNGGNDVTGSPQAGSSTGTVYTLTGGAYVVSEDSPLSGYTFSGFGGSCDSQGNVTVVAGQEVTCTLTNDDQQATLILVKHLPNDNGGQASEDDFNVYIDGGQSSWGSHAIDAGDYTVNEDTIDGYEASFWSGDCDEDGNISLLPGESKTCEITNDDIAPELTLVKSVINDNGGRKEVSDFLLFINGNPVVSGEANTLTAGVLYTASETTDPGYAASDWGGDCNSDGTITLAPGDDKTCTLTNDDQYGHLIVEKVTNPEGDQTSFNITATGDGTITGGGAGTISTAGSYDYEVTPGTYSVSETPQEGWEETANTCSEVSVSAGQSETCTITNLKLGNITVTKYHDRNADGSQGEGDEELSDWDITLDDATLTTDGNGEVVFENLEPGVYALSESVLEGWLQSNISCGEETEVDDDNEHSVRVEAGDEINCSIGNYHNARFTGVKWNDGNANGQNDDEPGLSGWTIFIDENGDGLLNAEEQSVQTGEDGSYELGGLKPGTYRVCEVEQAGWIQTHPLNSELNNCYEATIYSGDNIEATNFGNQEIKLAFVLGKSNDKSSGAFAGDTVTYSLNLTNTSNQEIHNLKVTDVLPGGFTYVAGSTLIDGSASSDPNIASGVLTWDIGTLALDASVTITYQAKVPSDAEAGTYTNLATCKGNGYSNLRGRELAAHECDPAASSSVTIGNPASFGGSVNPAVLGAATELPASGSDTKVILIALAALLTGLFLKFTATKLSLNVKKGKKHGKN